jgi:phage gpG-like protein
MEYNVEVTGVDALHSLLQEFPRAAQDEGVLTQAAAVLLNRVKQRFLRQEAPDGSTWPESYAAIRRRESGRDGGTLFDTGALYHSINVYQPGPLQRAIYTGVPYAPKHEWGLEGELQRVFLGFSQGDIDAVQALFRARLERVV